MIEIELELDENQLRQSMESLSMINGDGLRRAIQRASKKLGRYLQTHIARAAAQVLNMRVSKFKQYRIKLRFNRQTGQQEVWIGTNPIAAHHLKNPRWKRTWVGAKAGGRTFKGAFMAYSKTTDGDHNGMKVFRRMDGQYTSSGKVKLKVETVAVHDDVKEVIHRLEKRANARYQQLLYQEINYELSKI